MTQRVFRDLFTRELIVCEKNTKSVDTSWKQRRIKEGK
jgi:hypothetical protein